MITRRDALSLLNPKMKQWEIAAKEKELDDESINNEALEQNQALEQNATFGQEDNDELGTE